MAADLSVVKDEQPGAITVDMIAAALERFKTENETPREHPIPEIGGVVRYRKLTGGEVQDILRMATRPEGTVDQQKMIFLAVNRATVEPKINTVLWRQLLQFPASVASGLSQAIQRASGMSEDPVADAGKDWSESPS